MLGKTGSQICFAMYNNAPKYLVSATETNTRYYMSVLGRVSLYAVVVSDSHHSKGSAYL